MSIPPRRFCCCSISRAEIRVVSHGAGMNDCRMAHRHVIAQQTRILIRQMDHGIILDIGMVADDDPVDIAAHHGIVPDTGMITNRHVSDHHRSVSQVNSISELGSLAQKGIQLSFDRFHV